MRPWDVSIIGGGASGALVATQLLHRAQRPRRIALFDRDDAVARGLAYSTTEACHLLNVPAGKMSWTPEAPDDFLSWLGDRGHPFKPSDFVPRRLFGEYLAERLEEAMHRGGPAQLEIFRSEVRVVERTSTGFQLTPRKGAPVHSRAVVLAMGNLKPPEDARGIVTSAWRSDALAGLGGEAAVLLIGTGLTMVDMVLSLSARGHQGPIRAVSRHALLPRPHRRPLPASPPPAISEAGALRVTELLSQMEALADRDEARWLAVVDSLRPLTAAVWQRLSVGERARFLRHLRTYWEVHRHRMAPEVAETLAGLRQTGQLELIAGRVRGHERRGEKILTRIHPRHGEALQLESDRVLRCTGPLCPSASQHDPLITSLLEGGLASEDPNRLSIRTEEGRVLDREGKEVPSLHAIGSLRRAELWESTAIPELREQARALAVALLGS